MTEVRIPDRGGCGVRLIDVGNGLILPFVHRTEASEVKEINDKLPSLQLREDDVLLCSYPKTGTHWLYEVITMLLNQSAERVTSHKVQLMMESCTQSEMEQLPSPRLLNTHLQHRYLPMDVKNKQTKTVLVARNPRDTAVSFYHHDIGLQEKEYDGKWDDWLDVYMEGKLEYGQYEEYLQGWETAINGGLGFPLHIVYYEDMHENGLSEIQRLADFLGVKTDTPLQKAILEKCSFQEMVTQKFPQELKNIVFKGNFNLFRKGKVGDWKNWFTVAQTEKFDSVWTSRMAGYTKFKFRYQL